MGIWILDVSIENTKRCQSIELQGSWPGSQKHNWDYTCSSWFLEWVFVVPSSNLIYRPLNILAGASTWQNLTAWLERGQKPMHYTAVLGLLLRTPYRNSELWMRMIRFPHLYNILSLFSLFHWCFWDGLPICLLSAFALHITKNDIYIYIYINYPKTSNSYWLLILLNNYFSKISNSWFFCLIYDKYF